MRYYKHMLMLSCLMFLGLTLSGCSTPQAKDESKLIKPHYQITYQLPDPTLWYLAITDVKAGGYTQIYKGPVLMQGTMQMLSVNYQNKVEKSMEKTRAQLLKQFANISCESKKVVVYDEQPTEMTFSILLNNCQTGTSKQMYKVFNMPDGRYTLLYSYTTILMDENQQNLKAMQAMVENAQIKPVSQ